MAEDIERKLIPEQIRRALSLTLTLIAAILYAGILGNAVVRSALEEDPVFSDNMLRAAGFLSGLVGSVVSAGFAKSQPPVSVQMTNTYPMGGRTLTARHSLNPPSLVRRNLVGLASLIGLYPSTRPVPRSSTPEEGPPSEETPPAREPLSIAVWIALLYFAVYFLVGISAFFVTIWHDGAPEIVVNSGWVWLGTVISSAYSFLGLNAGE
ncbi:MAG: hypothetical protein U9R48_07790 [Chloroflexota bacterium]|nr:hypothetical protein [Chloroflexota bacterium]